MIQRYATRLWCGVVVVVVYTPFLLLLKVTGTEKRLHHPTHAEVSIHRHVAVKLDASVGWLALRFRAIAVPDSGGTISAQFVFEIELVRDESDPTQS